MSLWLTCQRQRVASRPLCSFRPLCRSPHSSSAIQVAKTATYLLDLVEVQRASFKWFLDKGLIEELESFSPITDYTGKLELHFIGSEYRLKRPRHDVEEAKRRDATFASQMYVTCRLVNKETGEIKESRRCSSANCR